MDKVLRCELCQAVLSGSFVDGRTFYGPWAMMCLGCHGRVGCGLGTGNGQKYRINPDGGWTKLSGKAKPKASKADELAATLEQAQQTIARLLAENAELKAERDSRPAVDPSMESYIAEREAAVEARRERRSAELNVRYLQGRSEQAYLDARIARETGINPQQLGALQRVAANWSNLARAEMDKLLGK